MLANNKTNIDSSTAALRKLLVLDLNGTLLLRVKRRVKRRTQDQMVTQETTRARTVHPRPYMTSFREYISHPDTRTWLDVMVWSSARHSSVEQMVDSCFARDQACLRAIWARDTLGLSDQEYVQTTKDLETVWNAFPEHSNRTTLLLDDSLLKARLQPYNHLCVSEYTSSLRKNDVAIAKRSTTNQINDQGTNIDAEYDATLLAVIGVLDHIRHVHDVSSWLRSNGLLALDSALPSTDTIPNAILSADAPLRPPIVPSNALPGTDQPSVNLWYENRSTVASWVRKGTQALSQLGINPTPGIRYGPS